VFVCYFDWLFFPGEGSCREFLNSLAVTVVVPMDGIESNVTVESALKAT
jgi:hypothetical protein